MSAPTDGLGHGPVWFGLDAPGGASPRLVRTVAVGSLTVVAIGTFAAVHGAEPLPVVPGFTLAYVTALVVVDLLTAALLSQQTVMVPSRAVAALTGAYAFAAVVAVTFLLSFPGAFRDGVILGGSQSAVWQYYLARIGFLALVAISSALALRGGGRADTTRVRRWAWVALPALAGVGVGAVAIGAAESLPVLLLAGPPESLTGAFYVLSGMGVAVGLVALAVTIAAARRGARLRVWLVMVIVLVLADVVVQLWAPARYTVAWYTPRVLGAIGAATVLVGLVSQVARQARALAAAQGQTARLVQVVEQSPLGYFLLDRDLRVVDANQGLVDLTGWSRAELVGQGVDLFTDLGTPDALASMRSRLTDAARPDSVTLRLRIRRKDGSAGWATVFAHPVVDADGAVVGTAGSMSDASAAMAGDLDPAAPTGMALLNAHGIITEANEALCALVGRDPISVAASPFGALVHPDDRRLVDDQAELLLSGARESGTVECRLAGGTRAWVTVYQSAVRDAEGTLTGRAVQVIDISGRKRAERAADEAQRFLRERSTYDDITGLLNRPTLVDRLQSRLDDLSAHRGMAVLLLDVDGFQQVSNALTRVQGDAVLVQLARRLVDVAGSSALVGRPGGDEFIVAVEVAGADEAADLARRLLEAVAQGAYGLPSHQVQVTVSVGVTVGGHRSAAADLLQEADVAVRQAKRAGRRTWQMFDRQMRTELLARMDLTDRIRSGLVAGQFHAWYQPIVALDSGSVVGFEALSRWVDGDRVIAPDAYLPVAEDTGLVVEIGGRAVDEAVAVLAGLPAPLTVAVNASPTQLLSGDLVARVRRALARHDVDPRRLVVEITEQALFDAGRADDAGLGRLADLGVGLHVDDFGTGYSSITHIRDFPITGIKLDRSFTAEVTTPVGRAAEIAGVLGELARRLDLDSVAEGIETAEQAERLRALGWVHGQGWLFGRPAPSPGRPSLPVVGAAP